MAAIEYVGPAIGLSAVGHDNDVVTENYATELLATNLTSDAVSGLIGTALSGHVSPSDVTSQIAAANLLTQSQVDTRVAVYLPTSEIGQPSGVPSLDTGGRIPVSQANLTSGQRFPIASYSPTYATAAVSSTSVEQTVFTRVIPDPGYSYRVVVTGYLVGTRSAYTTTAPPTSEPSHTKKGSTPTVTVTSVEDAHPLVRVRAGSGGPVVAQGRGMAESYPVTTGLYVSDNFNRSGASNLGPNWHQDYSTTSGGQLGISANEAAWVGGGAKSENTGLCLAQRMGSYTNTDDQYAILRMGTQFMQKPSPVLQQTPTNDVYLRMSADRSSYVRISVQWGNLSFFYTTSGRANEHQFHPDFNITNATSGTNDVFEIGVANRSWAVIQNSSLLLTWTEGATYDLIATYPTANKGSGNRGWGFGMQAGGGLLQNQVLPASVSRISVQDNAWNYPVAPIPVIPTPLDAQTPLTGSTTLYFTVIPSDAATVSTISPTVQGVRVMVVPA